MDGSLFPQTRLYSPSRQANSDPEIGFSKACFITSIQLGITEGPRLVITPAKLQMIQ
jgi:hypothetical protein